MKKIAIIFNGKNDKYEAHRYNILFKILPLGNPLTWISCSSDIDWLKKDVVKELKGKYKLIEIYELS